MNKKILIGSLVAVFILIMVTFTSVVGYQSAKSNSKINSPLFGVRNKTGEISANYIGKEEETNLYFPKRNSETESFDKVINIIKRMDDKSFDRFVKIVIANINHNNKRNDVEVNDEKIAVMLFQLRDNSEVIKNNFMMIKDKEPAILTIQSMEPACWLLWIIIFFSLMIAEIVRSPFKIMCLVIPSLPTFN